jgi:hypothetical protein
MSVLTANLWGGVVMLYAAIFVTGTIVTALFIWSVLFLLNIIIRLFRWYEADWNREMAKRANYEKAKKAQHEAEYQAKWPHLFEG